MALTVDSAVAINNIENHQMKNTNGSMAGYSGGYLPAQQVHVESLSPHLFVVGTYIRWVLWKFCDVLPLAHHPHSFPRLIHYSLTLWTFLTTSHIPFASFDPFCPALISPSHAISVALYPISPP